MKLRYSQTALRQIENVLSHVDGHSPQGAVRLRERLSGTLSMLEEHPFAGQATSRPRIRRVVSTPYPYVMFYRVVADEIIVIRFRHAARKPLFEA